MLEKSPVSDVCTIITRGISPAYDDTGIPVLSQKCVRENQVILEAARFTNPEMKKIPADKLLRLHDVLVNSTGVGTLGRVAQVNRLDGDTTVDSHVTIVRPDPKKIDPRFFGYSMVLNQPKIESMGEGATGQTELSRARLGQEILIPRPPLLIQRQIADILSAYDDLIENNLKCIKILEEMARSLYREWFVYFRFPGYEKVKFVDSPLGRIPQGWEVKKLGDIADISWGDTSTTKASYMEEGYPAYSASGLDGKLDHYDFDRIGIVLSAIGAQCGRTWLARDKWSCIKNTIKFWSKDDCASTEFLFIATEGQDFWPRRGAAQPFISQGDAERKDILIPDLFTMNRFTKFVENVSVQNAIMETQVQNLRRTRDLLLPRLLSGSLELNT